MRVQARVGAPMRAWVGLGLHLWVHFWCKQTHELVSFPPGTALLEGLCKDEPAPHLPDPERTCQAPGKAWSREGPGVPDSSSGSQALSHAP